MATNTVRGAVEALIAATNTQASTAWNALESDRLDSRLDALAAVLALLPTADEIPVA